MREHLIVDLRQHDLPLSIGTKAENLRSLIDYGLKVPATYACSWEACQPDQPAEEEALAPLIAQLRAELEVQIDPAKAYAVRSSANLEDGVVRSFAGQFSTFLDRKGVDSILSAMQAVWASANCQSAGLYQEKMAGDRQVVRMGVVIQEMVPPVVSGVAFSRNPITGLSEVVIEAVKGSGEQLVQDGLTPYRWIQRREGIIQSPEQAPLSEKVVQHVARQTRAIARRAKCDVDLEWVFDGESVQWVQMRRITALQKVKIYSHSLAKQMVPGMLKPLVLSTLLPTAERFWKQFVMEVSNMPEDKIEPTVKVFHYNAYIDVTAVGKVFSMLGFPEDSVEMVMGIGPSYSNMPPFRPNLRMLSFLPSYLRFIFDKLRFDQRLETSFAWLHQRYQAFGAVDLTSLSAKELLAQVESVLDAMVVNNYIVMVQRMILSAYTGVLRRQLKQSSIDFETLDLLYGLDEIEEYHPGFELQRLSGQLARLEPGLRQRVSCLPVGEARGLAGAQDFFRAFDAFLERFGYLSDNGNDFSTPTWRERPDIVFQMVAAHDGQPPRGGPKTRFDDLPLPGWKRQMTGVMYRRVRLYRLYREHLTSLFVKVHELLRTHFLEAGRRLAAMGCLDRVDDVFLLQYEEVRMGLLEPEAGLDWREMVAQRKEEMARLRGFTPPQVVYGDQEPPINLSVHSCMKGIPTSKGYYTGRVRVICCLEDFPRLELGDVLVVPYSDVGWTPLFLKAGAVVSELGGILSHSSIIAREYGIPAVVSVAHATRLQDGCRVTVDGYQGEVVVLGETVTE